MRSLICSLMVLATVIGCKKQSSPTEPQPQAPMSTNQLVDSVNFTLAIAKQYFGVDDTLAASLTLENQARTPRTYSYTYSPLLQWSFWKDTSLVMGYPHVVSPVITQLTLNLGESKQYSILQAIRSESGASVIAGTYTLYANLRGSNAFLELPVVLK